MERFHSDITFLLVSTKEEATGDRMYGLSTVWVNPYQARVSTVEETVRQLMVLVSSGPNWHYTLVQLNQDTHDLSDVFWCMVKTAKLLGLAIYEINVWKGPDELLQANYTLRTLPKGLKFLRVVPPLESPKVMGLMGIHDPNALHHFNGMPYCPWCGKEGQNEGTIINHLQMVHYRLGLMCDKCYSYPSTSLDTLYCHGQQNCQPSGEGGTNESSLSA